MSHGHCYFCHVAIVPPSGVLYLLNGHTNTRSNKMNAYAIDGLMTATDEATAAIVVELLAKQGWNVVYRTADDTPHDYDDNAEFCEAFWNAVETAQNA